MKNNFFNKSQFSNIFKKSSKNSEITSQILYGEKFKILSKNKDWIKIKSLYDNYVGYIKNKNYVKNYKNNLSNNAQILLKDINNSYKKNILPSKRQSFYTEEKSILWAYIRPDYENVYIKNNLLNISTKENFLLANKMLRLK